MKRKLILLILFTFITLSLPASGAAVGSVDFSPVIIEPKQLDGRAIILRDYLEKHNSPLQYHAQDFIDAADTYQLDYKLVPAIAGVESTFGKAIPGGYNGWGWGVYGNQALGFNSWRDGIFEVSKGLKEGYVDKGLKTPYEMNRVYAASPAWGAKVTYFQKDIENFAQSKKGSEDKLPVNYNNIEAKTAVISAKLATGL